MLNVLAVAVFAWSQRGGIATRTSATLAFAWAAFVGGYHWLQPALVALWDGRLLLSWVVWGALAAWFALRFLLIAWGFRALERRGTGPSLALTVPWVMVEWLYPSLFPFYLGSPWVGQADFAAVVALGGPLLLSALLCVVGATIAEVAHALVDRRAVDRATLAVTAGLVGIALVGGMASNARVTRAMEGAPSIVVGVVQENIDVAGRPTARVLAHRRYLEASKQLESTHEDLDLVVWPETAYSVPMVARLPTSGAIVRDSLRSPLLFGGVIESPSEGRWNSALLVDADGKVRSSYHKHHLIPFAEFVPLAGLFSTLQLTAPSRSSFEQGPRSSGIRLGDHSIATPICYEAIRPDYVRRLVLDTDADFIVTLANDGWFGDSAAPHLHLMLARMRAIEHRRYVVRATNTGISAIVDPFGRVVDATSLLKRASLVGEVRALSTRTLYGALGNWPAVGALVWLLVWVWRRSGLFTRT